MKRLTQILLLCITISTLANAQQPCNDYSCMIAKAKRELNSKQFKSALNSARGAKSYPNANINEAEALIDKIFDAIENQRKIAEDAEKKAKNEAQNAQKEQLNVEKVLTELKLTAQQTVDLLVEEIDRDIYALNYDSAIYKCQLAVDLKENRLSVEKRIFELAYFYTECDTFQAAAFLLNLIHKNTFETSSFDKKLQIKSFLKEKIPPQYFAHLQAKYYPPMILIKGGEFIMGGDSAREQPLHPVILSDFKMSEAEITFWQYSVFAKAKTAEMFPPSWGTDGDNPATNIDWFEAEAYLEWLSQKTGEKYRFPTEAEWEYAAKGGIHLSPFRYSGSDSINEVAWHEINSNFRTHPIKEKKPNILGLYDMTGNAWEWCADWFNADYYKICLENKVINNPLNTEKSTARSIRGGGAYFATKNQCKIAFRYRQKPELGFDNFGIRAVISQNN